MEGARRVSSDSRPEASREDVARWVDAVRTMPPEELGAFERQTRRTYQHHSLIDFIRAVVIRREQLERDGWYRMGPSYRKPAGGFLAVSASPKAPPSVTAAPTASATPKSATVAHSSSATHHLVLTAALPARSP
jgi:hypothetical protein